LSAANATGVTVAARNAAASRVVNSLLMRSPLGS
jgi:hypothetical protein